MSDLLDLARQGEHHLAELVKMAPALVQEPELAFATAEELELLRVKLAQGIEEVEAHNSGKPSPRSVRMQGGYDARDKEQADRLARETEYARKHNWEVGVPPTKR
jgi:hypothetical protein